MYNYLSPVEGVTIWGIYYTPAIAESIPINLITPGIIENVLSTKFNKHKKLVAEFGTGIVMPIVFNTAINTAQVDEATV